MLDKCIFFHEIVVARSVSQHRSPVYSVHLCIYYIRHLMNGVEGDKSAQLGVEVQVPDDFLEGPEATEGLEVRQRDGHLGLVVVVCVHVGPLGVKLLGELFVRVSLRTDKPEAHAGIDPQILLAAHTSHS